MLIAIRWKSPNTHDTPAPSAARHVNHLQLQSRRSYLPGFTVQDAVKRLAVGIWKCKACKKTIAGGAWTVSTTAAATVRRYVGASVFLEPLNIVQIIVRFVVCEKSRRLRHPSRFRHPFSTPHSSYVLIILYCLCRKKFEPNFYQ